jgi:hypothetical protein
MSDLPTGTVIFLFTDIEGSTQKWKRNPDAMRAACARHDAILSSAIRASGGTVFKTVGDAFCAVFSTAPLAMRAAFMAQQALHQEAWGRLGRFGYGWRSTWVQLTSATRTTSGVRSIGWRSRSLRRMVGKRYCPKPRWS